MFFEHRNNSLTNHHNIVKKNLFLTQIFLKYKLYEKNVKFFDC